MPGLFDVAHAAEDLQRGRAELDGALGAPALDDGNHELDERLVLLAHASRRDGAARSRARPRSRRRARASLRSCAFMRHQHAAHVGMVDDRHRALREPGLEVAALHALLGVLERALVRAVGERDALHADREARGVHHDEHVLEPAVRLADQIADGAAALLAVVERAGRVAR